MNVRLQYDLEFLAGVYYDDCLQLNSYEVSMNLLTKTKDSASTNIAMERLKAFVHGVLESTVFINQANMERAEFLQLGGCNVTTLPEEPVDQIIGMMLYSKLDSVMEGRMTVTQLKLSSELGENVTYFQTDNETIGPFAQKGWWNSAEPSVSDSKDGGKIVSIKGTTTWQLLGLDWGDKEEEENKGNTVVAFRKDENE